MPKAGSRKTFLLLAALLALSLLATLYFYSVFQKSANSIVASYGLPRQANNSVKHAYTAALIYKKLCQAGLAEAKAEAAVLALGSVNEYAEKYLKFGTKDTVAEVRKDFYNNLAGIIAVRWQHTQANKPELQSLIAKLAANDGLVFEPIEIAPEPGEEAMPKIAAAELWLGKNQQEITRKTVDSLNGSKF